MSKTNPFAIDADEALARQEQALQRQQFERDRAAAIRQQQVRNARRAQIKATIAKFIQGFESAVRVEFTNNPRKPWSVQRILAAGEYVAYLTSGFVSGQVPTAPEISQHDAGIIRDKFVWGLVVSSAKAHNGAAIPDGALVGQHGDWFSELYAKKEGEYARFQERKAKLARPATNPCESTTGSEAEKTGDPESTDPVPSSAVELTPEMIAELAEAFKPASKVGRRKKQKALS